MNTSETIPFSSLRNIVEKFFSLGRWLVEPSKKITDLAQRRKARLLSIFLLATLSPVPQHKPGVLVYRPRLSIPGCRPDRLRVPGRHLHPQPLPLCRCICRAPADHVPLNVFQNVTEGTSIDLAATLSFLIPSYVLASIFLNSWGTGIYGYGINLGVFLLRF